MRSGSVTLIVSSALTYITIKIYLVARRRTLAILSKNVSPCLTPPLNFCLNLYTLLMAVTSLFCHEKNIPLRWGLPLELSSSFSSPMDNNMVGHSTVHCMYHYTVQMRRCWSEAYVVASVDCLHWRHLRQWQYRLFGCCLKNMEK